MSAGVNHPAYRLLMTADTVGGVWRYALDAAAALSTRGVAVAIVTLGPRASLRERAAALRSGVEVIETDETLDWLCEDRRDVTRAAETVAQIAREFRADVVQLNGTALAADAHFDAPVLAAHHSCLGTWWSAVKSGPLPETWIWRRDLMREHLMCADGISAPTLRFAQDVAASYGLPETPTVIRNGRPTPPASPTGEPVRYVFTAGRLWDEGKNVATLDRAALQISAPVVAAGHCRGPHGGVIDFANLQAIGALDGEAMRVRLSERPIFASVPLYEPFGLAVLEAAQAGCALILSDIGSFRELWDEAAIFVQPTDAGALAEAANRLLSDPSLRNAMGAKARRRATKYSLDRMGEGLFEWHRGALQRSDRAPWGSAA